MRTRQATHLRRASRLIRAHLARAKERTRNHHPGCEDDDDDDDYYDGGDEDDDARFTDFLFPATGKPLARAHTTLHTYAMLLVRSASRLVSWRRNRRIVGAARNAARAHREYEVCVGGHASERTRALLYISNLCLRESRMALARLWRTHSLLENARPTRRTTLLFPYVRAYVCGCAYAHNGNTHSHSFFTLS